jgi:LysM repeat protein
MAIKPITEVVRDRRRILWTVAALISFVALARCASGQTPKPVPPVITADSTHEVTHTVKKGDTLWDLAQFYLKDPFRWPDIFRRNTDIVKNPHWIYPGEVIRIPVSELRPEIISRLGITNTNVVARINTVTRAPTVFSTGTGGRAGSRFNTSVVPSKYRAPGVRAGEIEAAPYVDRSGGPRESGEIRAAVDRPAIAISAATSQYQLNDALYISLPKGMTPRLGDRYLSYTLGDDIEDIGTMVVPTAILRIERIAAGEPPMARIVRQFGEVRLGQRLVRADIVNAITRAPLLTVSGLTGKVIHVHEDPVLPSVQHYVVLSPNSSNGVSVGDEFTLIDITMGRDDPTPAPPTSAAVAQVVKVTPYGSTAIILNQIQPAIKEGMPVRMTAKMPR